MGQLSKAIQLAVTAHDGQVDKAGKPYIFHPLAVMAKVLPVESHQIVAVLHDVVEDTHITLDDLRSMGFTYLEIWALQALTRVKEKPYKDYIQSLADLKNFQEDTNLQFLVLDVKIQDLKHNHSRCNSVELQSLRERYERALKVLIPKYEELKSRL